MTSFKKQSSTGPIQRHGTSKWEQVSRAYEKSETCNALHACSGFSFARFSLVTLVLSSGNTGETVRPRQVFVRLSEHFEKRFAILGRPSLSKSKQFRLFMMMAVGCPRSGSRAAAWLLVNQWHHVGASVVLQKRSRANVRHVRTQIRPFPIPRPCHAPCTYPAPNSTAPNSGAGLV